MGFNLSGWALSNRSLVVYLMVVAVLAGLFSFSRLGRAEDPSFVIKTMVVSAAWPGATVDDLLQAGHRADRAQAAGDTESRLPAELHARRRDHDLRQSQGQNAAPGKFRTSGIMCARSIGDIRHTLPAGIVGPFFDDDFGDTFGIIYGFTADGFTHRELRDRVEGVRSKLLTFRTSRKSRFSARRTRNLHRVFHPGAGRSRASIARPGRGAAGAERRPARPGRSRPAMRRFHSGYRARSGPRRTSSMSILRSAGACCVWATLPECGVALSTRRNPCFASTGSRRSALRSRCAMAATSWRSARTSSARSQTSPRICRSA